MTREEKLAAAKVEANEKAEVLSEELKTKVHPLVFMVKGIEDPIVGYMKEPNRTLKMAVMDKFNMGFYSACGQALDLCILREHSDPRIYSEKQEDDIFYFGALNVMAEMIQFASNQVEKKS